MSDVSASSPGVPSVVVAIPPRNGVEVTQPTGPPGAGLAPPAVIAGTDPATVPLTVQGAAGQSANRLNVKNSAGTTEFAITAATAAGTGTGAQLVSNGGYQLVVSNASNGLYVDGVGDTVIYGQGRTAGPLAVGDASIGTGFGGGAGPMVFIANDSSDPSTNPVGGGILFVSNGALKWRGSSGTVTTIAPA